MNTVVHNKLVRDRIPEIITGSGRKCSVITLSPDEYEKHLNAKLAEEVREYLESGEIAELADLEEVILAIISLKGLTREVFEGQREAKRSSNGGFEKAYFLISAEEPEA